MYSEIDAEKREMSLCWKREEFTGQAQILYMCDRGNDLGQKKMMRY